MKMVIAVKYHHNDLPSSGRPRSTNQRQDHLLATNAFRDQTQNAAAAFSCHRSLGRYPYCEKPSTCCSAAYASSELRPPVRGGLSHNGLTLCSQSSRNSFSIFMTGGKGFGVELGSVASLQPGAHMTAREVEVSWLGEGSP